MDRITPEQRSAVMASIRSRDTKPEMLVRRVAHALGYRFRLHSRSVPGSPDLVFARLRAVVFVHGCFWHRHTCATGRKVPKSRLEYWGPKLARNAARDKRTLRTLRRDGWRVLVIWECQTRDAERLRERLGGFSCAKHQGDSGASVSSRR